MTSRIALARIALRRALGLREERGISASEPICAPDLAESIGIEVKFWPIASMEGMYFKDDAPVIVVSSERPMGRQAFTCAHEMGHHVFGHGNRVDELANAPADHECSEEETLADLFAGFLLMPKQAVTRAFQRRGWKWRCPTPLQVYTVAGQLGVSYAAVLAQMEHSLGCLPHHEARTLSRTSPKMLRDHEIGAGLTDRLLLVDPQWEKTAADLQVGNCIRVPRESAIEGNRLDRIVQQDDGLLLRAVRPGVSRCLSADGNWAVYVRTSRRNYVGRCKFRHLEDPDYES
jgi:Zn-dependent peptidase ImmA (M78 family)